MGYHEHKQCIDACLKCAAICNHCIASCLQEPDPKMMVKCIQLDIECAAICYATAQLISLDSEHASTLWKLCAEICEACAKECAKHFNKHCKECVEACLDCAAECNKM
jgi:hypothetical protein